MPTDQAAPDRRGRIPRRLVRVLARQLDLRCWDRPASPCLASRVPYGLPVTREKLRRIEAGEDLLRRLGFPVARVRHFEGAARIEVPSERLADLAPHRAEIEQRLLSGAPGTVQASLAK